MKQKLMTITLALACALALAGCGSSTPVRELNVYNWGEYIADGSDGSIDTAAAFEDWYRDTYGEAVRVNYSTFSSNEDLYNKLAMGAVSYDLIIPSDYMVARMREEGMLHPLNFENIPNYKYISEDFHGLYYDPEDQYSIPYAYGIVGVIYDANVVDPADVGSWDLMWNEKYADSILQYNNSRDAFGTAMYRMGIDVNTSDPAEWDKAFEMLAQQKPMVKSYVMDEIYNLMQSGEASVASYYAGDYFLMQENQAYIDEMGPEAMEIMYPQLGSFFELYNQYAYRNLDAEQLEQLNVLWEKLKLS